MDDVLEHVLRRAAIHPGRCAVRQGVLQTNYAELILRARRYATVFSACAAPKVLIALPRGADAYVAMLGAWIAGGFYTPANDASPPDKLRRIVTQLQPDFVVSAPERARLLLEGVTGPICFDPEALGHVPVFAGQRAAHAIAYVMFTSGSTGEPKGVVVSRRALDHYIGWVLQSGTMREGDVVSQFNNLAFDVSVLDIFGALCAGATLVPIGGRGDRLMPARAIAREAITVWTSVPSAIDLMRNARQMSSANLRSVRLFTLAGEPLSRDHLQAIFAVCPDATVQNAYGPTEATITVSQMAVTAGRYEHVCLGDAVSIGPAIPGMGLHLAGGADSEGEIVITGPQLADRYWNDAERTAQAFRSIEVQGRPVRGYYTGDWAQKRGDLLFFSTRIDSQVKIRGYRIELEEVASAIRRCGWPSVCVFRHADALVALVEAQDGVAFDVEALRAALAERVEAYAIPQHIACVPSLPRNENDKLDRVQAAALFRSLVS